jgi:hypothetical protein
MNSYKYLNNTEIYEYLWIPVNPYNFYEWSLYWSQKKADYLFASSW